MLGWWVLFVVAHAHEQTPAVRHGTYCHHVHKQSVATLIVDQRLLFGDSVSCWVPVRECVLKLFLVYGMLCLFATTHTPSLCVGPDCNAHGVSVANLFVGFVGRFG